MSAEAFDPARVQSVAHVMPVHVDQLIDAGYQPEQLMSPERAADWRARSEARMAEFERVRAQARAEKVAREAECVAGGGHHHVVRFSEMEADEDHEQVVAAVVVCRVCGHEPDVDDVLVDVELPVRVVDGAVKPPL